MAYSRRLMMSWIALGLGVTLGCMSGMSEPGKLPVSRDTPFVLNLPDSDKPATTARSQKPDWSQAPPPPAGQAAGQPPPIQSASLNVPNTTAATVRVRAWVNSKPIFEDEVVYALGPQMRKVYETTAPAQREAEMQKVYNKALDVLIESELLMQDALLALAKLPKNLEAIKGEASKEADKQIQGLMRANKIDTIDEFKLLVLTQGVTIEGLRRVMEREYISNGYLRMKIRSAIERVGLDEIREYFELHKNEFAQVDRVKWQNIFIAVGPKNPTKGQARQTAEQILQRWATGEEIAKLLEFDDGLAAANKGLGVGEIKGEIRPRELEASLFAMKEGEFGPLVELSTGVHIFRVLKRENAGYMPFDEKVQATIRVKLINEVVDRERGGIIRPLREKASIEIERN